MRTLVALLILGSISVVAIAVADSEVADPVEVYCGEDKFHIYGTTWEDERLQRPRKTQGTVYRDLSRHSVKCVVNSHEVVADFIIGQPGGGERGSCPGALITLTIDKKVLFSNAQLGGCFQALTFIGVTSPDPRFFSYQIELCGHTEPMSYSGFDGCVKETETNLKNKKMPLSRFPVLDLIR
jgi:hypothetical protein